MKFLTSAVVFAITTVACSSAPTAPSTPPAVPLQQAPTPVARMQEIGVPAVLGQSSAGFRLGGVLRNVGEVCAARIALHARFTTDQESYALDWTAPSGLIVRPQETVPYELCCLPLSVSDRDVTFVALIEAESLACPVA